MNPGSLTKVFNVIEQSFKASTKKPTKKQGTIKCSILLQNHKFPKNVSLGALILRHCKGQKLACKKAHTSPEFYSAHMIICQILCQMPNV